MRSILDLDYCPTFLHHGWPSYYCWSTLLSEMQKGRGVWEENEIFQVRLLFTILITIAQRYWICSATDFAYCALLMVKYYCLCLSSLVYLSAGTMFSCCG